MARCVGVAEAPAILAQVFVVSGWLFTGHEKQIAMRKLLERVGQEQFEQSERDGGGGIICGRLPPAAI